MAFAISFVVVMFFFFIVPAISNRGKLAAARGSLLGGGVLGRALVLEASRYSGETVVGGQRLETRQLTLDVEIPGQAPYEVTVTPPIPRFCEPLPGAVFDVRVNPRRQDMVAIVGPAGSSDWLGAAPWLTGASPLVRVGSSTQSPIIAKMFFAFFVFLMLGGFLTGMMQPHRPKATPAPKVGAEGPMCRAAVRCCTSLGTTSCGSFAGMSEKACTEVYANEKKTAQRLGKRCP